MMPERTFDLIEVPIEEIKEGDIIARDPDIVYPVYDIDNTLLRITGLMKVQKTYQSKTDFNMTTVTIIGVNINTGQEDCKKRFIGKPVHKFIGNQPPT